MSNRVFTMAALFMIFLTCSSASAEQKPSSPSGIIEAKETEVKGDDPTGKGKTIQAPEKGSIETGKSGVSLPAADEQRSLPVLDRRWIIKMKDEKKPELTARKPSPTAWADNEQKIRCESYATALRETFGKARQFSIGGDACSTAHHAKSFMNLIEQCSKECPEGYAESKGYSMQIIRNVDVLRELGEKRCFQAVSEGGPVTSESKPRNAERQSTTRTKTHKSPPN